jgi:hypothetical protein
VAESEGRSPSAKHSVLPTNPAARRLALIVWVIGAVAGSAAVWWLSSYLETLTTLAATDRGAALELFRSRALPALVLVVAVAVVSGGVLLRQGLELARAPERQGHLLGRLMAAAGFLLAAIPLALISVVFYLLGRA